MKYDKLAVNVVRCVSATILVAMLTACAGAAKKEVSESAAPAQENPLATRAYLPVRKYDKDGNPVEFVAAMNPYLLQKGKIDKDAILHFVSARKAYKREEFDQAETLLQKVIAADNTLAGPWIMLGDIARKKKQNAAAITHYQKAIEVNKFNINAYLPLAILFRQQGEFVKAQNTYVEALEVWKDFPEAHLNLGLLYDIYLNDSLQGQQHLEAYQFLTQSKDEKAQKWLDEIQSRTGIAPNLYIGSPSTAQAAAPQ